MPQKGKRSNSSPRAANTSGNVVYPEALDFSSHQDDGDSGDESFVNSSANSTAKSIGFEHVNISHSFTEHQQTTIRRRSNVIKNLDESDGGFDDYAWDKIEQLSKFFDVTTQMALTVICGFFLMLFAIVLYFVLFAGSNSVKTNDMKGLAADLERLFPDDGISRAIFFSAASRIVSEPPQGPEVILLAVEAGNIEGLIQQVGQMFDDRLRYQLKRIVVPTDLSDEERDSNEVGDDVVFIENVYSDGEFFTTAMKKLNSVGGRAVVFVENIHLLTGRAPLALQTLSDEYAATFKNSLLVLTIKDEMFGSGARCNDMIYKFLLDNWENDRLKRDQIEPIISRITKLTRCLPL